MIEAPFLVSIARPKDRIKVIGEKPDHLVTHFKPYRRFANDLKKLCI
jgi:hypothetical protein